MSALTKKLLAIGASGVIAVTGGYLVGPWEGGKKNSQGENIAYLDIVGIPTICAGFTHGVKLGDKKTDEECDSLLLEELTKFNTQMKKNVRVSLSQNEEVAYTSFVWNVGVGAWNSSTLLKKLNAGDREGACRQLLVWNKATFDKKGADSQIKAGQICTPSTKEKGKYSCTVKGLTNRRTEEYKVCSGENADVASALAEAKTYADDGVTGEEKSLETIKTDKGTPTPHLAEINAPEPVQQTPILIPNACKWKLFGICIRKT